MKRSAVCWLAGAGERWNDPRSAGAGQRWSGFRREAGLRRVGDQLAISLRPQATSRQPA